MSVGIYKFESKVSGNIYIGQSVNIEKRIKRHISDAYNESSKSYNYPLESSIRKYGIENIAVETIETCLVQELDNREIYWIEHYQSFFKGYNQTLGGNGGSKTIKITSDDLFEITKELKETSKKHNEIAAKFDVSVEMIQGINTGRYWKRDIEYPIQKQPGPRKNYCSDCGKEIDLKAERCEVCYKMRQRVVDRPEAMVLAKEILDNGFESVGRKYGVSGNSIKKWCVAYGMGKLKHEVAMWYEKNKELQ